jgi:carboxyl-terminal processing protease
MEYKNSRKAILYPVFLAVAIAVGILIGRYYKSTYSEKRFYIYPRADKLTNVLNFIESEYVDPVSKEELVESAIPKILEDLDPHSQYIPAKDVQRVNEPLEGNFTGIGVQFNMLNDTLVIISTIANGPSEKIGILAGDRIIKVDDRIVAGVNMPSDTIVSLLRGPKGTKVMVEILRRNVEELLLFEIVRDNIPLYSVDIGYMITNDIGYIKINKFSRTTYEEFITTFNELKSEGLEKLILDLRNNGGGYMASAIDVIDEFLGNEELIVYTEGNARKRENYTSKEGGLCKDIDVVVMIDEGSASASEIFAGAIQDNDRGIVIGRRTFGKGLVQEPKPLSDGSVIRLTIARYYTPTGRCIQKPYSNGMDEYLNDINNRYLHGELATEDSIQFDDSLKYVTPGGKIVYGGGGIMPDIFIPIDTTGVTDYYMDIRNRGLIYRFALKYADDKREELEKLETPEQFVSYLNERNILQDFVKFTDNEGIKPVPHEIRISEQILKTQLNAFIARNIIDNKGFYPIIREIDNTLQEAEKLFNQAKK